MYRSRFILVFIVLALIVGILTIGCRGGGKESSGGSGGNGSTGSHWIFVDDGVNYGISGVSPEAILLNDNSVRLYITDMGMKLYKSTNGLSFQQETASLPQGADPTVIHLDDGTYRMYYVDMAQGTKVISTATSPDGLSWTKESSTGISNPNPSSPAWGVPDSIETPNGQVRLYWVAMPSGEGYEVVRSAISADGRTFTYEDGYRTTDGFVDPYIMIAEEGDWVGLFSTTPATERSPQRIYVGTSTDGLTWLMESQPVIIISGGNAFDPTAILLEDGSYRVYYIAGSDDSSFGLRSGILKRTQ